MKAADLYRQVTQRIIAQLEAGVAPWVQPWTTGRRSGLLPRNATTGRPYSGINIPILWDAASRGGFTRHEWMTFKQALGAGGVVRKGEKGTPVVFTKRLLVAGRLDDETDAMVSVMRVFTVFNADQVEGLPSPDLEAGVEDRAPILKALDLVQAVGAEIRQGSDQPCYFPRQDYIAMPDPERFESAEHYFATALHELTHWTGHETRLNRDLSKRFGSQAYAAEELVAEFGAAFACAELEIKGALRHAEYLGSWLQLLQCDDKAVFTAASKASQAADFLRLRATEPLTGSDD